MSHVEWVRLGKRYRIDPSGFVIDPTMIVYACPVMGCEQAYETIGELREHCERSAARARPGCRKRTKAARARAHAEMVPELIVREVMES